MGTKYPLHSKTAGLIRGTYDKPHIVTVGRSSVQKQKLANVPPSLLSSRPLDFQCTIVPRDDRAKELIIAANMAG